LLPALKKEGIHFLDYNSLNERQRDYLLSYFEQTVSPVLTPRAIDRSRPFPVLNNRAINIFVELTDNTEDENEREPLFAMVQVPSVLPRLLPISDAASQRGGFHLYILLEEIIVANISQLFPGHTVVHASLLRVTRNSDLLIDEDETGDLMVEMEKSIKKRRMGDPVRIEISYGGMSPNALAFLEKALDLDSDEIYVLVGTRINENHHDPTLPVEIEIRKHLIQRLTKVLSEKFMKVVTIDYM
jgi:polyphosphate kinase